MRGESTPGLRGLSGREVPFDSGCRGRVVVEVLRERVEVLERGCGKRAAVGERVGRLCCTHHECGTELEEEDTKRVSMGAPATSTDRSSNRLTLLELLTRVRVSSRIETNESCRRWTSVSRLRMRSSGRERTGKGA